MELFTCREQTVKELRQKCLDAYEKHEAACRAKTPVTPDPLVIPTLDPLTPDPEPFDPLTDGPTTDPLNPTIDPLLPITDPLIPTTDPLLPTTDPLNPVTDPTTDPLLPTTDPITNPTLDPSTPACPKAPTPIVNNVPQLPYTLTYPFDLQFVTSRGLPYRVT